MTNKQLETKFMEITEQMESVFDLYSELENLNKEYMTTPFAHLSKKTVHEAYDYYYKIVGKTPYILNTICHYDWSALTDQFNPEDLVEQLTKQTQGNGEIADLIAKQLKSTFKE